MNDQEYIKGEEIGEKLLQSVREMQAGLGRVVYYPITEIRAKTGLSEAQFAEHLGMSVPILKQLEQGLRQPTGAENTLLRIVDKHPEVLKELAA
jgi:putative transcriptional regulator